MASIFLCKVTKLFRPTNKLGLVTIILYVRNVSKTIPWSLEALALLHRHQFIKYFTRHAIGQEHLTNQAAGYINVTVHTVHACANFYPHTRYFSVLTPLCLLTRFTECAITVRKLGRFFT